MLKRFLDVIDYSFETFDDALVITSAEMHDEKLILKINLHFEDETDDYIEKYAEWEIVCSGLREQTINLGSQSGFDFYDEAEDHVLKWHYTKPFCGISFYGATNNAYEVIGKLYEAHVSIAENWIPFQKDFNSSFSLAELISGKFGSLAGASLPLAEAYVKVMKKCGFSASHSKLRDPRYWNGKKFTDEVIPLSVMIFDERFVIAEKFTAAELSSKTV
jgi:hypothetical protein